MVLLSQIGFLFTLSGLAVQDLRERLISVLWFVALAVVCVSGYYFNYIETTLFDVLATLSFLAFSLSCLSVYHRIRYDSFFGFVDQSFGLGDILFLLFLAFVLPFGEFVFFFIVSMLIVLIVSLVYQSFYKKENFTIPLAGGQAILLGLYFILDWWSSVDFFPVSIL